MMAFKDQDRLYLQTASALINIPKTSSVYLDETTGDLTVSHPDGTSQTHPVEGGVDNARHALNQLARVSSNNWRGGVRVQAFINVLCIITLMTVSALMGGMFWHGATVAAISNASSISSVSSKSRAQDQPKQMRVVQGELGLPGSFRMEAVEKER